MIKGTVFFIGMIIFSFELDSSLKKVKKNQDSDRIMECYLAKSEISKKRYLERHGFGWLCNFSDSDDESEGATTSVTVVNKHLNNGCLGGEANEPRSEVKSKLFGFLEEEDHENSSYKYLHEIYSIFAKEGVRGSGEMKNLAKLNSALIACKVDIERDAESCKNLVRKAIAEVGVKRMLLNYFVEMREQIDLLRKVKKSFDQKNELSCMRFRAREIDRSALRHCLSIMACMYWSDKNFLEEVELEGSQEDSQ